METPLPVDQHLCNTSKKSDEKNILNVVLQMDYNKNIKMIEFKRCGKVLISQRYNKKTFGE